ncbi:MAG: MotA/TolQ/ExbB proton channel family protein [Solitalea-like symbiont of Acarus siro]
MDNLNNTLTTHTETTYNLLDIIAKGGILMIPLAFLFILAVYIFFNRYFLINKQIKKSNQVVNNAINYLKANQIEEIPKLCNDYNNLIAKVIYKIVLNLGKPMNQIHTLSEDTARIEVSKLEKNISILSLIAAIAPMVGFVGTVMGIIEIFFNIAQIGEISINVIAGGLYVKLITSAAGLIIGIIAYIFYYILDNKLDSIAIYIEEKSSKILEVLENPN